MPLDQNRLETPLLFGSLGNLNEAMGYGWSVEDHFAWAIGEESRLNLPLPGDESRCTLRLTLRPLVHPGLREAQRLEIAGPTGLLGRFSLAEQMTIEVPLPPEMTHNRRSVVLTLRHPDAVRPSAFKTIDDNRLLTLCFLSGALQRDAEPRAAAAPLCHLVLAGGGLARQLAEVLAAVPALRQVVAPHFVDTERGGGLGPLPEPVLQQATLCWQQADGDSVDTATLHRALPPGCIVRRFAVPRMAALWPFLADDPRSVPEADRYPDGRYPFGDRIGASLAQVPLPDDVLLLAYTSVVEKEVPNPRASLDADIARWRQLDAAHDMNLADYIVENFRRERLFFAPSYLGGPLLREMVLHLARGSAIEAGVPLDTLRRDLDLLLTGYVGRGIELPIAPLVARQFGLVWWRPGMRYRWYGDRLTFEEYALRYMRWTPWRP